MTSEQKTFYSKQLLARLVPAYKEPGFMVFFLLKDGSVPGKNSILQIRAEFYDRPIFSYSQDDFQPKIQFFSNLTPLRGTRPEASTMLAYIASPVIYTSTQGDQELPRKAIKRLVKTFPDLHTSRPVVFAMEDLAFINYYLYLYSPQNLLKTPGLYLGDIERAGEAWRLWSLLNGKKL